MTFTMLRQGRLIPVPPPETALRFLASQENVPRRGVIGSPPKVRAGIEEIASRYGAEEVIVVNISYDHAARRRSYELIADVFDIAPREREPPRMRAECAAAACHGLDGVARYRAARATEACASGREAAAGGGRATPVVALGDRRARARLRRHLPAGDRAPERAGRARGARARRRARERPSDDVLAAYAEGFEAMGALTAAGHPALYDRGWHPTAVCGAVGAAVAAAHLLGADRDTAAGLAALRAGGLRAAFGSDGKSIQVGLAAATGVAAARLAAAGATVAVAKIAAAWRERLRRRVGHGARRRGGRRRGGLAVASCHRAELDQGRGRAACRPTARSSAPSASAPRRTARSPSSPTPSRARPPATTRRDAAPGQVLDPLHDRVHAPARRPARRRLRRARPAAQELAARISVRTDPDLGESEFALLAGDEELARVDAARGSPLHPSQRRRAPGQGPRPRRRPLRRARRGSAGELLTRL